VTADAVELAAGCRSSTIDPFYVSKERILHVTHLEGRAQLRRRLTAMLTTLGGHAASS
jgi:hypothetical protein